MTSLVVHFVHRIADNHKKHRGSLFCHNMLSWRWLAIYRTSSFLPLNLGKILSLIWFAGVPDWSRIICLTSELLLCVKGCYTCCEYSSGRKRQKPWWNLEYKEMEAKGRRRWGNHTCGKCTQAPSCIFTGSFCSKGGCFRHLERLLRWNHSLIANRAINVVGFILTNSSRLTSDAICQSWLWRLPCDMPFP